MAAQWAITDDFELMFSERHNLGNAAATPNVIMNSQPPYIYPPYRSSRLRGPTLAPIRIAPTLTELTGPDFSQRPLAPNSADLTTTPQGAALGERIIVTGLVRDRHARPLSNALIELWQCNAAGRYRHVNDQHDAPLDPNFVGHGCVRTDASGEYRIVTIRPGAYPWRNHDNAWRPAHIHFSLFGHSFSQRLITQMYFPGDPLLARDPIYHSIEDPAARERLVAQFDWDRTVPEVALAFRFDLVLDGDSATPWETPV